MITKVSGPESCVSPSYTLSRNYTLSSVTARALTRIVSGHRGALE